MVLGYLSIVCRGRRPRRPAGLPENFTFVVWAVEDAGPYGWLSKVPPVIVRADVGIGPYNMVRGLLFVQQLVQLRHEGVDVLELAVHAGEADVGHLVGGLQLLHDLFADDLGAGLPL